MIEALREAGGADIPLVVGGIIPDADVGAPARGRRRRGLHAEGLRAHAGSCATSSALVAERNGIATAA